MASSAPFTPQSRCARALSSLPEADVVSFVDDTIQFLKGHKVPFLTKYNAAFGGNSRLVVPCRDLLLDIVQLVLRKSAASSGLDTFKQAVSDFIEGVISEDPATTEGMDFKFAELIAVAVFARRTELAKVLTELVFRDSVDSYLLDYNYNVETVISSDSFSKQSE